MMYFEGLTAERLFEIANFIGLLNQFARCSNRIVPISKLICNEPLNLNDAIVYDDMHPYTRSDGSFEYRVAADVVWDVGSYDIVSWYDGDMGYDDMLFRVVEEDIDGKKHLFISIRDIGDCSQYEIIVENGTWYFA